VVEYPISIVWLHLYFNKCRISVLVTLDEDELYFTSPSRLCAMRARARVCACVQEVFSVASDFSDTEI
jgi:hypothetical protein